MSFSRSVATPQQARDALGDPGGALDLRAHAELDARWAALGFRTLVPGELVRPLPVVLPDLAATRALGARLAVELRPGDLVVLTGPLGAGKTALTQGLGQALGVRGAVTSPTFVLARTHRGSLPLTHVDAYRLRGAGPSSLLDLDLELALEDGVVVVEWGAGLVEEMADSRLEVALSRPAAPLPRHGDLTRPDDQGGDRRTAQVLVVGPRWAQRAPGSRGRPGQSGGPAYGDPSGAAGW